jgi:thymidylate synthase
MLTIAPFERLEELTSEHFQIHDYNPHPSIPAPVAV